MARAADAEPRRGEARLFAADEEVGRDLAAVDWAATPLGRPGSWPQSLQTAVDILLSSRFPMWMAWGPQLTFFCNDAYRRDTLGRKYPWALGRPASEVWEEIWGDIGPRIDIVLATGQATWDEGLLLFLERSGYPEESYHTFSYSPLRDEDAAVVGMLCVVREDTERVIAERRMATLRDLGSDPSVVRTERETLEFAALDAVRHQPAASVALLPGDGDGCLLAAPLGGTGSSAIVAEFPSGGPVGAEARELFSILTSHLGQVLAKARDFQQARAVALTLQHAILAPTELPHGFAARYTPAVPPLEVGGDWYDVIALPGQRTGVVVGDCVGRGLPAAAVMGQLRSASQAVLLRACGPAEALTDLDTFADRIPGAECATMFCAIIDHATGIVTYSCAGHPPPILVTAGGDYRLLDQARSLPLGMLPDGWERSQAAAALPAGATLMLYTDGLVERRNQPLDAGIDAAAAAITERVQDHPDLVADHVMLAMTPAAGYDDDVAALIYRHPPAPLAVRVSADDPSSLSFLRAELRRWLAAAGIGGREASDVMIAAGEATANAVEHATAGRPAEAAPVQITLTARADHATLRLTVTDTGTWRPPPADPEQPAPGTRGHGVIFMHALMSEVTIDPAVHGTTVTLTKDLNP